MFLLLSPQHKYRGAFELQGQRVQGKLLFLYEAYLPSHIVVVEDEVALDIVLRHYLPSELPNGAILGEDDHFLVSIVAHEDLHAALHADVVPYCGALDEVEEDLDCVEADFRIALELIHHLEEAHLPGVDLGLVVLLVSGPQEDIDRLLDYLVDVRTLAHSL